MEIRTYEVFTFQELSKDAKQNAINKWYEAEEYPFLEEEILAELENLDERKIFSNIKLKYSLSYSQGDGLSFSAAIDIKAWLKAEKWAQDKIDALAEQVYKFHTTGNQHRYYYASDSDVEFEPEPSTITKEQEQALDILRQDVAKYYLDICRKAEKYGYSVIEYRMSEEEFADLCDSNGYMFLANGKMD